MKSQNTHQTKLRRFACFSLELLLGFKILTTKKEIVVNIKSKEKQKKVVYQFFIYDDVGN